MSVSDLFARRNRVVEIIVEEFITSGSPVGSLLIVQQHRLGVSSATIRNIMARLEEEGLLTQPYTSAGRIPTDEGYRYYVDRLMRPEAVGGKERDLVEEALRQADDLEQLWVLASRLVAELTGETGLVLPPRLRRSPLRHLELMPVGSHRLMALWVMQPGVIKQVSCSLTEQWQPEELERLTNLFNREFAGQTLEEIIQHLDRQMLEVEDSLFHLMRWAKALLGPVQTIEEAEGIHWEGLSRLMEQPELRDPHVAQGFLRIVDSPQPLVRLLEQELDQPGLRIRIGREQPVAELRAFTLITQSYGLGPTRLGVIGLLGPKRMPYAKVVNRLQLVADGVNRRLAELVQ